jgi:hypothetical protein
MSNENVALPSSFTTCGERRVTDNLSDKPSRASCFLCSGRTRRVEELPGSISSSCRRAHAVRTPCRRRSSTKRAARGDGQHLSSIHALPRSNNGENESGYRSCTRVSISRVGFACARARNSI